MPPGSTAHGFKSIPVDPHRLVRKASSIAADLDTAGEGEETSLSR
jgi:hypothetical protein